MIFSNRYDQNAHAFWVFYLLEVVCLAILIQSCKPVSYQYTYQEPTQTYEQAALPQILFMTFAIKKDSGESVVTLLEKKTLKGVLKSGMESSTAEDRIFVVQLSKEKTELSGYYLEHPLRKNMEYLNEQQEYETRWVELEEAEFFIRVALDPACAYIGLYEMKGMVREKSFLFSVN